MVNLRQPLSVAKQPKKLLSMACSADLELLSLCLQYYIVRWCNLNDFPSSYCYYHNSTNVTAGSTHVQFKVVVKAGDTYNINVHAVIPNVYTRWSYIQKKVPPLNIKVNSAYSYKTGRGYGLQLHLYWYGPYGRYGQLVSKDSSSSTSVHFCFFFFF